MPCYNVIYWHRYRLPRFQIISTAVTYWQLSWPVYNVFLFDVQCQFHSTELTFVSETACRLIHPNRMPHIHTLLKIRENYVCHLCPFYIHHDDARWSGCVSGAIWHKPVWLGRIPHSNLVSQNTPDRPIMSILCIHCAKYWSFTFRTYLGTLDHFRNAILVRRQRSRYIDHGIRSRGRVKKVMCRLGDDPA